MSISKLLNNIETIHNQQNKMWKAKIKALQDERDQLQSASAEQAKEIEMLRDLLAEIAVPQDHDNLIDLVRSVEERINKAAKAAGVKELRFYPTEPKPIKEM